MQDCVNCRYHETYYTKCAATFYRHHAGYCSKCKKLTENHDRCEEWSKKCYISTHRLHKKAALSVLEKISRNLSVVAQILTDDCREKEEESKE